MLSWFGTCTQTLLPIDRYRRTRIAHFVWQICYRVDDLEIGVQFQAEEEMFLFSVAFRLVLEPIHTPIEWVLEDISGGIKWQECEADHSPPSGAEVNNMELYHHSPIHLHSKM
jgi:hypothetical protein